MRWTPTEEELRRSAAHVAYEIRAFRLAWAHHSSNMFAYTAWFIHCRNLLAFFEGRGKGKDLLARHYINGNEWHDMLNRVQKPDNLPEWRKALSRLAAHLTYHRVELAEGAFVPNALLTSYVLGLALEFLRLLPPPRLAWFGDMLL